MQSKAKHQGNGAKFAYAVVSLSAFNLKSTRQIDQDIIMKCPKRALVLSSGIADHKAQLLPVTSGYLLLLRESKNAAKETCPTKFKCHL